MSRSRLSRWVSCPWTLSIAFAVALTGCHTPRLKDIVLGPDYQPANVHRLSDQLPKELRRIAVLPMTCDETHPEALSGTQTLETVMRTELMKTGKFELVAVSPDDLGRWTGRKKWDAEEKLPTGFLQKVREELTCEGVLFCRLTRYRPYPPLAIGWKLKLVEVAQGQTVWAIDEIFDVGEPLVSNAARRYEQQHQKGGPLTDTPLILTSPARFGQYTASAVFGTMPAR